jgi:Cd2+/Zn2+-exporting ATPase
LLVLIGWLGQTFFRFACHRRERLYITAYIFGGWDISQHAWHAIKEKHFDTDLLMVMAALGAAFLGEFAEGALLLFPVQPRTRAGRTRPRSRPRAVRALADLAPKTASSAAMEKSRNCPLNLCNSKMSSSSALVCASLWTVSSSNGNSGVDQASVTGESLPVDKVPGDQVFASTVNGEGALEVKVTRLAKDSTLSRVMKMVEEAQAQKSPTQQTVEKFERVFVPAVLILTALIIIVPPLFGFPFRESFLRAMTLLVAASPCALALGTPATILAGVAQAARNGVLVKGGAHLENLGRLKAIAFDKTGTVTHGKPEVTDIVAFQSSGWKEADVLSIAAGAESRSAHPLAQAVVRSAQTQGVPASVMDEVESLTGRGLRAVSNGKTIWIGNQKLMDEAGVTTSADALKKRNRFNRIRARH